jgi:prepilin-type N-terminal cleavage/methylation domain-containing protein/uncharacterized repeat protein (TIGR02543 family)
MKKLKGFTLIELMVVIAIIIILAAIAIPTYINMTRKANKASIGANMGVLATGLSTYYTDWGKYPVSLTAVNVATEADAFYKEFTGTGTVNNSGATGMSGAAGGDAYLSAATLKNMKNPFYSAAENGIMYVSDGSHYCIFAKISDAENVTALNPFGIQNVYASEVTVPETGSYLYRTDTSSNLGSSSWATLTSSPTTYPGEMGLTVIIAPTGAGTVTMNPSGGSYAAGTVVTLTESPVVGSSFTNWTGAASGEGLSTTVTMTGNKAVTANFEAATYTVTFDKNGGTTEASPTTRSTSYNTTVVLPTEPTKTGSTFVGWNTLVEGTGTTFTGTTPVIANIAVYAKWTSDWTHNAAVLTGYTGAGGAVTIPSVLDGVTITSIGEFAVYNCTGLTIVTIPNSVTTIGANAFYGCSALTSVTIGSGVTTIGTNAFMYCTALTSFAVDAGNASYSSNNGVLFNKAMTTLILYPLGKQGAYVIPSDVTIINTKAFSFCCGLTSLTIGSGVTSIGAQAFESCSNLAVANFLGNAPTGTTMSFASCKAGFQIHRTVGATGWGATWNDYTVVTP